MRLHAVLLAIIALLAFPAVAQVHRCNIGGKTVYSDKPCDDAGKMVSIPVPSRAANPADPDADPYTLQREAGLGRVAIGMTAAQVEQAWGAPRAVNSDLRADGRTDQWVYRRDGGDAYVYLKGGRVTSVSTHTNATAPPPAISMPAMAPTQDQVDAQVRADKAAERKYVRPGWSKGRVLAGLGPPDRKQFVGGEAWIYLPTPNDRQTATTIMFEYDRVFDVRRDVSN